MLDPELSRELHAYAVSHSLTELDEKVASEMCSSIRRKFVGHSGTQWWWDSLSCKCATIDYGDSDGLALVRSLLAQENSLIIAITDDEHPPWPALLGTTESVLGLLSELRFFEYFLTDQANNWVVFDTHHNSLVVAGSLLEEAENLRKSPKVANQ